MKKITVTIAMILLFLPLVLSAASKLSGFSCDVELKGFTDKATKPELSHQTYLDGSFQSMATAWIDQNLKPRGVLTKTYTTIRYNLFNIGNRPIGKHGDIYEWPYINSLLGINGSNDYSKVEQYQEMSDYVNKLVALQQKLAKFEKYLLVYVGPNKAQYNYDNIPKKIIAVSSENSIDSTTCFSDLIKKTNVPYIIFSKDGENNSYPAFYTTGIHWSRPFEQEANNRIIKLMKDITRKYYRSLVLGQMNESSTPYWRDADVFDLLNIWNKPNITYYEYSMGAENVDDYDKIRYLIQGDSFMSGLNQDILSVYPNEKIYQINRNQYATDCYGHGEVIDSFEDIDLSGWLDNVDVVIIEAAAPELSHYSYGFVDYLNAYLDTYEPHPIEAIKAFDVKDEAALELKAQNGIYQDPNNAKNGYAWTKKYSEITLRDEDIRQNGIKIRLSIPDQVFAKGNKTDVVEINVNGTNLYRRVFYEKWTGSIIIDSDLLKTVEDKVDENNLYIVEIIASESFIPKEIGENEDTRELALLLSYVGRG